MRVLIGSGDETYGIVEAADGGLRYDGDERTLHYYLRAMWRQAQAEGQNADTFLAGLPTRINRQKGRHWAELAPDTDSSTSNESESVSMSSPTQGTPPPQAGVRTVHTPRAIGAIPAKPAQKKPVAAKPAAKKPAPKRKK